MITAGRCTRSTPPVVVVKGASTASPGDAVAGTAPDSRRGAAPAPRYRLRPFDLHGPRPSRDTPLGQLVSHLGQGRRSHRSCGTGLVGREGAAATWPKNRASCASRTSMSTSGEIIRCAHGSPSGTWARRPTAAASKQVRDRDQHAGLGGHGVVNLVWNRGAGRGRRRSAVPVGRVAAGKSVTWVQMAKQYRRLVDTGL